MFDRLAVRGDVLWKCRVVSRGSDPMGVSASAWCDLSGHLEILPQGH